MRYINIDLSSDNYLQEPQIFGGYAGEHNETILQVRIPDRMVDIECSGYRFDFQTSEDNKISSPLIPVSELNDGVLSFKLAEQLTVAGKLLFNIVAILLDENMVSLISKTNRVILHIEDSPEGNAVLIDPNGYKDELQKMVDERVSQIAKGEKGEQGERGVSGVYVGTSAMPEGYNIQINPEGSAYELPVTDQTYNPESQNAQSGKAVAEAIGKWEKIVDITTTEEANGIIATVEEFPKIAKCKEFIVRVIFQKHNGTTSLQLGSSRLYFNEVLSYQINNTSVSYAAISELKAHIQFIDTLVHTIATEGLTGQAALTGGVKMLVGPRFVTEEVNEIKYLLSITTNMLPIGTQFVVYGKVEG